MNETDNSQNQLTDAQIKEWCSKSYQQATQFLAQQGIVTESVVLEQSRYLPPVLAFWKLKSLEGQMYWVISGEIEPDVLPEKAASSARDSARAFSLHWQARIEELRNTLTNQSTKEETAQVQQQITDLNHAATRLYQIFEIDNLWQ